MKGWYEEFYTKTYDKNFDLEFCLNIYNWKFFSYIFKLSLGTYAPLHSIKKKLYICLFLFKSCLLK